MELVPDEDPTSLVVRDALHVRLLWQGQPLVGIAVGAVGDSAASAVMTTTDDQGRVGFTLSDPGPWLIRATVIRRSLVRFGEWNSVSTTLTVEARPR